MIEPSMNDPGVYVETIANPARYSPAQLELAFKVAAGLERGRLVLCVPPARRSWWRWARGPFGPDGRS
jgi:hypothetical protein